MKLLGLAGISVFALLYAVIYLAAPQTVLAGPIPESCRQLLIDGQRVSDDLHEVKPGSEISLICDVRTERSNIDVTTGLLHVDDSQEDNPRDDDIWRLWVRPDTNVTPDLHDVTLITLRTPGVYEVQVKGIVPSSLNGHEDLPREFNILTVDDSTSNVRFISFAVSEQYQLARSQLDRAVSKLNVAKPDTREAVQSVVDNATDRLEQGNPADSTRSSQAAIRAIDSMEGVIDEAVGARQDLVDNISSLENLRNLLFLAVGVEGLVIVALLALSAKTIKGFFSTRDD